MDINELVASIEVELEAARNRETKARRTIEVTLATAQQDGQTALSDEDEALVQRSFDTIESSQAAQVSIQEKLAKAKQVQASQADFDARMKKATAPAGLPKRDGGERRTASVSVGREERTYSKGTDPTGKQFLADVARQFMTGDVRAADRLRRHMQEETVERSSQGFELRAGEVGTGQFSGLVVPQYLVDMVAPHVANLRPFADICNKHPLPAQGMSLNISRITTASKVELQDSAENAAQANPTALDDTLLTVNVQTALGEQTISRQAVERGTGIQDVVLQDLFRQYATTLDNTLVNQATHGLTNIAHASTLAGTPTMQDIFTAIMGATSQSETATLGMAHPTHLVMHPRRWYYLQSLLTNQWPAIASQANIPPRSLGTDNESWYNQGVAGIFPGGLKVVTDANILTNGGGGTEDEMFVIPDMECHLWEEANAPVYIRAEQPKAASLGVLLVVYGYFAFTYERYTNAVQKVTGAGLAAPTGF